MEKAKVTDVARGEQARREGSNLVKVLDECESVIRATYRDAVAAGQEQPIVVLADPRAGDGKQLADNIKRGTPGAARSEAFAMQKAAEAGSVPWMIVPMPLREALESYRSNHWREMLTERASKPGRFAVVIQAGGHNMYASLPIEEAQGE